MAPTYSMLPGYPNCDSGLPINDVVETYNLHQFMPISQVKSGKLTSLGMPPEVSAPELLTHAHDQYGPSAGTILSSLAKDYIVFEPQWQNLQVAGSTAPIDVEIPDVATVLAKGEFKFRNASYSIAGLEAVRAKLANGESVLGSFASGNSVKRLRLIPVSNLPCDVPERLVVDDDAIPDLGHSQALDLPGKGRLKLQLSANEQVALARNGYANATVTLPGANAPQVVLLELRSRVSGAAQQPIATTLALARPKVGNVTEIRMPKQVAEMLDRQMILYVPIVQTWTLKGYSRGMLLNTFSLTPQEQLTIEIFSWDRTKRSSETTSTFEVESSREISTNRKITFDALREAKEVNGWEFGSNLSFSVPQIGMNLGANFSVSNNTELMKRNTIQAITEATEKATTKIKSSIQTKVSEASEFGREERITRKLINPNAGRILHFDCFEVLATFDVATFYRFDRARLCVLHPCVDYLEQLHSPSIEVRSAALLALEGLIFDIVPARLNPGFSAARKHLAWARICDFACDAACSCGDKDTAGSTTPAAAGNPYQADLDAALLRFKAAVQSVSQATGSELSKSVGIPAAGYIGYLDLDGTQQAALRRDFQSYLYRSMVLERVASPFWYACLDFLSASTLTSDSAARVVQSATVQVTNVLNGAVAYASMGVTLLGEIVQLVAKFGANAAFMVPYFGFDDFGLESAFQALKAVYTSWEGVEAERKKPPEKLETGEDAKEEPKAPERRSDAEEYSAEFLAGAAVDIEALSKYLLLNKSLYRSAIWNALTPSDRNRFLGLFGSGASRLSPNVLGFIGDQMVVELNIALAPETDKWIRDKVHPLYNEKIETTVSLPVSGVSMQSRVEKCDALEPYLVASRSIELMRLEAIALQEDAEQKRRHSRIKENDLTDPTNTTASVKFETANPKP